MREGVGPNRHITFIVAEKIHGSSCSIYGILGERCWLKTSYWGKGLDENVTIQSYEREGG